MNEHFLNDLDEFFTCHYDDYNSISALKSFLKDNRDSLREVYTEYDVKYNFKPNEQKYMLCYQKNKELLLSELKQRLEDIYFEFSYREVPLKTRFKWFFYRRLSFGYILQKYLKKYGITEIKDFFKLLTTEKKIWDKILGSKLIPSKRLLIKICLILGTNIDDNLALMNEAGYSYNYKYAFDVVVRYLIEKKTFNPELIEAAFKEYRLRLL